MRGVPRIAPGVRVTPRMTPEGLRYRLVPRGRGGGTVVPPRTLLALMLIDGRRSFGEIHHALAGHGIRIRDPAKLLTMMRTFEAAGVIATAHHFETPGPLRHTCEGCGQSCQGHLVGPIDEAEAEALAARLEALRARHPEIPEGPATCEVTYEGTRHRVLHFPRGACIFLDAEHRCRLHATWGPHAKPLPCRMFPYRMVRTETGTRVTVSPRCFKAHHSYRSGPAVTPRALIEEWGAWRPPALLQGLDPNRAESFAATPPAAANLAAERLALAALAGDAPLDLAALLVRLARAEGAAPEPSATRRRAFGEAVLAAVQAALGGRFEVPEGEMPTRFGANVAALVAAVPELRASHLDPWDDLPEAALDYVGHALHHMVFARETMAFGSVTRGVLAWVMGVMLARWLTPRSRLVAGERVQQAGDAVSLRASNRGSRQGAATQVYRESSEEAQRGQGPRGPSESGQNRRPAVPDEFVRHLTVWLRLVGSRDFQAVLFPEPDSAERLLAHLAGPRAGEVEP